MVRHKLIKKLSIGIASLALVCPLALGEISSANADTNDNSSNKVVENVNKASNKQTNNAAGLLKTRNKNESAQNDNSKIQLGASHKESAYARYKHFHMMHFHRYNHKAHLNKNHHQSKKSLKSLKKHNNKANKHLRKPLKKHHKNLYAKLNKNHKRASYLKHKKHLRKNKKRNRYMRHNALTKGHKSQRKHHAKWSHIRHLKHMKALKKHGHKHVARKHLRKHRHAHKNYINQSTIDSLNSRNTSSATNNNVSSATSNSVSTSSSATNSKSTSINHTPASKVNSTSDNTIEPKTNGDGVLFGGSNRDMNDASKDLHYDPVIGKFSTDDKSPYYDYGALEWLTNSKGANDVLNTLPVNKYDLSYCTDNADSPFAYEANKTPVRVESPNTPIWYLRSRSELNSERNPFRNWSQSQFNKYENVILQKRATVEDADTPDIEQWDDIAQFYSEADPNAQQAANVADLTWND